MYATLIFLTIEILLAVCLYLLPQLAIAWALVIAVCPLLLLFFWCRPTLSTSQNVYSVTFALAFLAEMVLGGSCFSFGREYFADAEIFFLVLLACGAAMAALFGYLLGSTSARHFRLFALGVLFGIAFVCIPQSNLVLWFVSSGFLFVSAAFVSASAVSLQKRMDNAAKILQVKEVSARLLARNTAIAATVANLFFVLTTKLCNKSGVVAADIAADIVCAVLLFATQFVYLAHPLETVAEHKLNILSQNLTDYDVDKLREQVVAQLSEQKTCVFAAFLRKVLPFFFRTKTIGAEKVKEPYPVFVANHYEIFGPFITELKFPIVVRPWTDSLMTNRGTLTRQLRSGVDIVTRKWVIKPIRKHLPAMISGMMWRCINSCRPISVYRRNSKKIATMFEETVESLETGDAILVFPEKSVDFYKDTQVDTFQTGFVEIAEKFKAKTGKDVVFYPLYIDKRGKKMTVGNAVTFDSEAPLHDEKTRVATELYIQMDNMAKSSQK